MVTIPRFLAIFSGQKKKHIYRSDSNKRPLVHHRWGYKEYVYSKWSLRSRSPTSEVIPLKQLYIEKIRDSYLIKSALPIVILELQCQLEIAAPYLWQYYILCLQQYRLLICKHPYPECKNWWISMSPTNVPGLECVRGLAEIVASIRRIAASW